MVKIPRGGKRTGTPGTAYPNRTDLSKPVPVQAATGQPYGAAKSQTDSQKVVPVAPPAPPAGGGPPAQGTPAPQGPPPGGVGAFGRPTDRPGEPITAGLPTGAGPGPDALMFNQVSSQEDIDLKNLKPYLPVLELMASQPGASQATINFVRRLRGASGGV